MNTLCIHMLALSLNSQSPWFTSSLRFLSVRERMITACKRSSEPLRKVSGNIVLWSVTKSQQWNAVCWHIRPVILRNCSFFFFFFLILVKIVVHVFIFWVRQTLKYFMWVLYLSEKNWAGPRVQQTQGLSAGLSDKTVPLEGTAQGFSTFI